jgi:hypothetical protein
MSITDRRVGAQELFIAQDLDQVRHVDNFVGVTKDFADTLLTSESRRSVDVRHKVLSSHSGKCRAQGNDQ